MKMPRPLINISRKFLCWRSIAPPVSLLLPLSDEFILGRRVRGDLLYICFARHGGDVDENGGGDGATTMKPIPKLNLLFAN